MLTIMMVTFNRLDLTKKTLANLTLQNVGVPFNLVIIDNGSTDGTIDFLKTLENTHIRYNEKNLGIGIGRNLGLIESAKFSNEFLCTLDNDVILPDGWGKECIDILNKAPGYGAIGVNFEGTRYPEIEISGIKFQNKPQGNLGTACMVFGKKLHKMLGFFNYEGIGLYGLEDSYFGCRIRASGFKLGYLLKDGEHLGSGENDVGEYRKFKTEEHNRYLAEFSKNCGDYYRRVKGVYVGFKDEV